MYFPFKMELPLTQIYSNMPHAIFLFDYPFQQK